MDVSSDGCEEGNVGKEDENVEEHDDDDEI